MAVTAAAAEVYSLEAKAESLAEFLQSWKSGSCKHLPAPSWLSTAPEETKTLKKTICAGNNAMEFRFGFTLKSKCGYNFQTHTHKRQEQRQRLLGCGEEPASALKRAVGYTKSWESKNTDVSRQTAQSCSASTITVSKQPETHPKRSPLHMCVGL